MTDTNYTLPKGLYKRGDMWHARVSHNKVCYTKSLKTSDLNTALERLNSFRQNLCITHIPVKNGLSNPKADWAMTIYISAKKRAKANNVVFDITYDDVVELGRRSGMRCEVTDIQFSWSTHTNCRISPFIPSLDKIDCKGGYTKENVRLVCWAVNLSLSDWGSDVFMKICKSAVAKMLKA